MSTKDGNNTRDKGQELSFMVHAFSFLNSADQGTLFGFRILWRSSGCLSYRCSN